MFMSLLPLLVCFSCSRIVIHQKSNANNQCSWACSPYLCASHVQEFWSIFFFNVALSWSMSMFKPTSHLLLSNISHDHIFVPTSPPLSSISIRGMWYQLNHLIPIWKVCISLWQRIIYGIDGWGLNLAFFMDIPYVLESYICFIIVGVLF